MNKIIKASYIMESGDEIKRLEKKTSPEALKKQVVWAGLKPGMRTLDVGCGSGKTTSFLKQIIGFDADAVGLDYSTERIGFAKENYEAEGITFFEKDIYDSLDDLGRFDFIWVRFFLEYHLEAQFDIVKKLKSLLNPGGIICLADLDHNNLSHYGISRRLEKALESSISALEKHHDFDPYAGRKLYTHLYDLGFADINVEVTYHHLVFGAVEEDEEFNWLQKVAVGGKFSGYDFPEYENGFEEFYRDCRDFFRDPRSFTYTPLIICRGISPS
ncbi:MAG TPA: methyltransferase type 11 [Spirochaeta sp.]|nr:methyltransferase type 11 [Spirochaeta sp.]